MDYPAYILASMNLLAKLDNIKKNATIGDLTANMLVQYTTIDSFHGKLSPRIFDNIEDSNSDYRLTTLKDLLSTFARLSTGSRENAWADRLEKRCG